MALPRKSTEPKPGDRRFSPKSMGLINFGRPMSPALTDQPKNDKNKNTHIDAMQFKSPRGSRRRLADNREMITPHTPRTHCKEVIAPTDDVLLKPPSPMFLT